MMLCRSMATGAPWASTPMRMRLTVDCRLRPPMNSSLRV